MKKIATRAVHENAISSVTVLNCQAAQIDRERQNIYTQFVLDHSRQRIDVAPPTKYHLPQAG